MQLNIKEEKRRKGKYIPYFIFAFLIPFLTYFSLYGGFRMVFPRNAVKEYLTYSLMIDSSIGDENKTKIETKLSEIKHNGKNRFEIVTEDPDYTINWKEGEGIINKYIVPISHVYAVTDSFNPTKQSIYVDPSLPEVIIDNLRTKYQNINVIENPYGQLDEKGKKALLIDVEKLTDKYKLLELNSKYFLDDKNGGITYSIGLDKENSFLTEIIIANIENEFESSFAVDKVGTLIQTGVTAISRDLASKTDKSGNWGYAALKISSFLKNADITHTSNEVSFVKGCVPTQSMRFCARPEYIKALKDSGIDIVELTGNHNNDYGSAYNTSSINTYTSLGWKYFGGGLNDTDASKILYVEIKDTKIAFIGYNFYDTMLGSLALAGKERAGANSYSDSKMKKNIEEANKNADIVIVDFQFQECYSYPEFGQYYPPCYKPLSNPDQKKYFRMAVDYGADIVVGTQAHQPQTYEIYKGKMIYYGLGNLFFDQIEWPGTRQGIVLKHYLYNGEVIQTKLTTTYYENDMQTYVTTGSKRTQLLQFLFDAR